MLRIECILIIGDLLWTILNCLDSVANYQEDLQNTVSGNEIWFFCLKLFWIQNQKYGLLKKINVGIEGR